MKNVSKTALVHALNLLVRKGMIAVFTDQNTNECIYKYNDPGTSEKLKGPQNLMEEKSAPSIQAPVVPGSVSTRAPKRRADKMNRMIKFIVIELKKHPQGTSQEALEAKMKNVSKTALVHALNLLVRKGMIAVFTDQNTNECIYKYNDPGTSEKLKGLTRDQRLIYAIVESVGREGVWTRHLKTRAKIQHGNVFQKSIKALVDRKLIKSFKSVQSKCKKFYILENLEPAAHHIGGIWYDANLEFDHEFVEVLTQQCFKLITERGYVSLEDVRLWIQESGISKVAVGDDDVRKLLDTLIFDGQVETFKNPHRAGEIAYKPTRIVLPPNGITLTPCGICPVFDICGPEGVITPSKCVYMNEWLNF
eukprot:TRINITY_DN911_c0_g1_i2.p1 TRINITY_DN911_c0_g1~~TRINITY_DN911_c0_g1_i2.p1  ORF type:complete len:363 (-),score=69.03 TRINITY_DN911_c0_g1_i2:706-1794(-)